ncbi:TonB-dependent receptor [Polynucleobacter sp. AM-26B4]|uniref:TonB-dependent receptor n=1 Tax=Polynucleobacter sp. AM-26B4 TaxID=2689103 RepID=UPI001C0DDFE2|nr:TonB-dependent receptor plug domain-containing protein [Polynucleobacter sp. AM-26B4]MBU3585019.1 TonB-dependent receptor plug domain-containing protein [Polynucleobacter sp. AM-26B4]
MFTKPSKVALACAGIFAAITVVHAQTNSEFNPVVVSASRFEQSTIDVPALVEVITKEQIKESGVISIPEALSQIGNLNVRNLNGGQLGVGATVDMRGFGASAQDNTLILVDGQRMNPIDSGSVRWESIPMNSIERIEILNGSGSVQYGDKAVGGVINIITRSDRVSAPSISVTAGSFGTAIASGNYGKKFNDTKFDVNFSASNSEGWRDNGQASQGVANVGLTHYLNKIDKVFLNSSFNSQSYGTPGGVLGEVGQGNPRATKWNNVGDKTVTNGSNHLIGIVKSIDSQSLFEVDFNYRDSGATQYTPNLSAKTTNYDKWSYNLNPRLKKSWQDLGESVFGFDYSQAMGSFVTNTGNIQKANLINQSYYLTHRVPLSRQLDLLGGFRRQTQDAAAYDLVSGASRNANKEQSANASDIALNYKYGPSDMNKVFVRTNNSYRFANIDEYWGWDPVTYDRVFSGILSPQKNTTLELGGDWLLTGNQKFGASVYQMNSSNEIRYDHATGININSADIRRYGVTANADLLLAKNWTMSPKINLQSAKYTAGSFDGKSVALVPKVTSSIGLAYKPKSHTTYTTYLNYVGSQYYEGDESNTKNKVPSFATVDLSATYKYGSWESALRLKNIFDKRYANYGGYGFVHLAPGNNYGNSYYYYPADPRAIFITTRYTFK